MAREITKQFVIAGRPGERKKVEIWEGGISNEPSLSDRLMKISPWRRKIRLTYGASPEEQDCIWSISDRAKGLLLSEETQPWKCVADFLFYVNGRLIKLDVAAMAVLEDDALQVELRRMLINFNYDRRSFRPRYRPGFAVRRGGT